MQPSSKEMQGMASMIALQDLQNGRQSHSIQDPLPTTTPSHDDFLDQMLSSYPSWPDSQKQLFNSIVPLVSGDDGHQGTFDDSVLLASRLRQHQISGNSPAAAPTKPAVLTQPQLLAQAATSTGGGDSGLLPLPLTHGSTDSSADSRLDVDGPFGSHNPGGDATVQGLYNGYGGSLTWTSLTANNQQPHFQHPQVGSTVPQAFNAPAGGGINQAGASAGNGGAPRQRVRARRGQATDPHSIAERLRRERIAERMKALQELVPNGNKTDKASMLDEIIDYVKFLQLQVKVLSMSRLGGAAAVAPLVAANSSEAANAHGRSGNGIQSASATDSLTVTENQVAKLMEEDMGSAMQYLQGKGLCLMPISLASAISSATRNSNPLLGTANGGTDAPLSPSMSVLTVQSAIANGGGADTSAKDAASVSKP